MTAIILLPEDDSGYSQAKLYRSDTVDGEYSLLATINVTQKEYEDVAGDCTKFYKVSFTNGETDTDQVAVQSLVQKIIDVIRIELKVPVADLTDTEIEFAFDSTKGEVMTDICNYAYGVKLPLVEDGVYKIPNKFYFDANFGGTVSVLDIELFKQSTPIAINTPKVPVTAVTLDVDERFVEIESPLTNTEILKMNYYYVGRKVKYNLLQKLIAYKICAIHFENLYTAYKDNPRQRVRVGDITIDKGTKTPTVLQDTYRQMNSKYQNLVRKVKVGFVRVK